MKKLLLLAVLALSGVAAFAQGTVNFANGASGVNAPITNGVTLLRAASGDQIMAMLYVGAANVTEGNLTTNGVGGGAIVIGGTSAGYFLGGSRTIDTFGGVQVTLQVRAWFASAGATYEAARAARPNGGSFTGQGYAAGNTVQVTLATGLQTPPNMTGLAGFTVPPVIPEPSSIALGLLGLGALAMIRRRK
jgi:hypothetical protein